MGYSIEIKKKTLCKALIFLWLVMMMVIPAISMAYKLITLFALILMRFVGHNFLIYPRSMVIGFFLWELLFAIFMINGLIRGFEFDVTLFEIYFIRPIVLLIICPVIIDKDMYQFLTKVLVELTICIGAYNVFYMFGVLGIFPKLFVEKGALEIVQENFLSIRTSNQTALMFLAPFIITLFFQRKNFGRTYSWWILLGFILCMGTVLMSGRRALQVVAILFIVLNACHILFLEKRKCLRRWGVWQLFLLLMFFIIAFLIINQTMHISAFTVYNTIFDAFDDSARSSIIRTMQKKYLIYYWKQKPLLGWGLSAYVADYIRWKLVFTGHMQTDPWSYEHFYVALLFQTGLIGIGFITLVIILVFRRIYSLYKKNSFNSIGTSTLAILAGAIGFLITGSTNPMVTSLWMWFIILGVYNYAVRSESNRG